MTAPNTRPRPDIARAESAVASIAAAFPETREDNPWGHRAFKVRGKTFLFLVADGEGLSVSVKLPESGALALELPFAEPTGYGLGKSGWVSARFRPGTPIPVDMIGEWLTESYSAIAPKKLSASLAQGTAPKTATPARSAAQRPAKSSRQVKLKAKPPARSTKTTPTRVKPALKPAARKVKRLAPARATASRRRK